MSIVEENGSNKHTLGVLRKPSPRSYVATGSYVAREYRYLRAFGIYLKRPPL